jgi:hypothetical protein
MSRRGALAVSIAGVLLVCACDSATGPSPRKVSGPNYYYGLVQVKGVVRDALGLPVQGARVEANGGVVQFSDTSGAYFFPSVSVVFEGLVDISVTKPGYYTGYAKGILNLNYSQLDMTTTPPTATVTDAVLVASTLFLPVDATFSLSLSPIDPPWYVGQMYYSETCYNCVAAQFAAPSDADVVVDLDGGVAGQPALQLWALGGAIAGVRTGATRVTLTLPRGRSGTLNMGAVGASVTQTVPFAITTRSQREGSAQ